MKKLICLLCICLLIVGGMYAVFAEAPPLPGSGGMEPQDSDTTPNGGDDDGGIGGGGGWPQ
ncbi:MAG: hypothetical protein HXS46_04350 [Theionarchaea archaeon]|nr:hypothetical protein [Theionarchaea archaeon]